MAGGEANYDYLIDLAGRLAGPGGRVLDFGCGQGPLVARGLRAGLDISGADTWQGGYHAWAGKVDPAAKDHIHRIEDGKLPFADATFDVVIANQVFEHIDEPPGPLREIHRVIKPGGAFVAAFPTGEVWFEGHVGIYFPHFLRDRPELQKKYLRAVRRRGYGYYGVKMTTEQWAEHMHRVVRDEVWYHSWREVKAWWRDVFGAAPRSLAGEYMAFRAGRVPALKSVAPLFAYPPFSALATFVCHKRAGRVLLSRKT